MSDTHRQLQSMVEKTHGAATDAMQLAEQASGVATAAAEAAQQVAVAQINLHAYRHACIYCEWLLLRLPKPIAQAQAPTLAQTPSLAPAPTPSPSPSPSPNPNP